VVLPISPRRAAARPAAADAGVAAPGEAAGIEAGVRSESAAERKRLDAPTGGRPAESRVAGEVERIARERIAGALPGVTLGQIAQRALDAIARERRRDREARRAVPARDAYRPAEAPPAMADRGPTLRPVLRASAANARRASAPPATGGSRSGEDVVAAAAAVGGADAPSAARAQAAPAFHFDPLEERRPARESDDELAERIGQVLREQARRQGVDLT
jgi:hypothetical protein